MSDPWREPELTTKRVRYDGQLGTMHYKDGKPVKFVPDPKATAKAKQEAEVRKQD